MLAGSPFEKLMIDLFVNQLEADLRAISTINNSKSGKSEKTPKPTVSLCAKWAPRYDLTSSSNFIIHMMSFMSNDIMST